MFVKKIRQTSCDVFLTAREEEEQTEEEEKEKNAKISLLPFSVSSSLLLTNVSSQSNNLHNFGDHNIA